MTKQVHTPANVAHLWAHQTQDSARNPGGTLYFRGATIYSYGDHFPIARLCRGAVLFTTRTYSVTTARHIKIVRQAIPFRVPVFYVLNPSAEPAAILAAYIRQVSEAKAALKSAKSKPQQAIAFRKLEQLVEETNRFRR